MMSRKEKKKTSEISISRGSYLSVRTSLSFGSVLVAQIVWKMTNARFWANLSICVIILRVVLYAARGKHCTHFGGWESEQGTEALSFLEGEPRHRKWRDANPFPALSCAVVWMCPAPFRQNQSDLPWSAISTALGFFVVVSGQVFEVPQELCSQQQEGCAPAVLLRGEPRSVAAERTRGCAGPRELLLPSKRRRGALPVPALLLHTLLRAARSSQSLQCQLRLLSCESPSCRLPLPSEKTFQLFHRPTGLYLFPKYASYFSF